MGQAEKAGQEPIAFDLNAAVTDAIGACDGDLVATIRSLVVANNFLLAQNQVLSAELDYAWKWISPGYTRSTNKRREKRGPGLSRDSRIPRIGPAVFNRSLTKSALYGYQCLNVGPHT